MIKEIILCVVSLSLLSGCAHQEISRFHTQPTQVCIAKHDAVKGSFLQSLQEGFEANGTKIKIVQAEYIKVKKGEYSPIVDSNDVSDCDAIAFYVANWNWDLGWYMIYADIWITDSQRKAKIAQATFNASSGLDKYIDADAKVLELVDELYGKTKVTTETVADAN